MIITFNGALASEPFADVPVNTNSVETEVRHNVGGHYFQFSGLF